MSIVKSQQWNLYSTVCLKVAMWCYNAEKWHNPQELTATITAMNYAFIVTCLIMFVVMSYDLHKVHVNVTIVIYDALVLCIQMSTVMSQLWIITL